MFLIIFGVFGEIYCALKMWVFAKKLKILNFKRQWISPKTPKMIKNMIFGWITIRPFWQYPSSCTLLENWERYRVLKFREFFAISFVKWAEKRVIYKGNTKTQFPKFGHHRIQKHFLKWLVRYKWCSDQLVDSAH